MANTIVLYLIAFPIAFIVDLLWIGVVANRFYRESLGEMFAPSVNWVPAVIFYLIYIAGLVFFVISPAIAKHSFVYAVGAGAFLGLIAYATYDLTNLAVIRNWPLLMSVVDIAWGVFMTALTSGATYLIATSFFGR